MFLAKFPTEILAQLSRQLVLTDLVMLHACGNGILNEKLRTAAIFLRVLSTRCSKYYELGLTSRFHNIPDVIHFIRSMGCDANHIPPTTKRFLSNSHINLRVHSGVDVLTVGCIGMKTVFEREPGTLEVSVEYLTVEPQRHVEYITHLQDFDCYDEEMVNLKSMDIPKWADIGAYNVPGVKRIVTHTDCFHPRREKIDIEGNKWSANVCSGCRQSDHVIAREGTHCLPIPSCDVLQFSWIDPNYAKTIFNSMSRRTNKIVINSHLESLNEVCDAGCFDLIPESVKRVEIYVIHILGPPIFRGFPKAYPFVISIDSNSCELVIENFAGIDECAKGMFETTQDWQKFIRKHPRLSITS